MSDGDSGTEGPQHRGIGRWGALSTVAGSMLGIGIFIFPPVVADHLPNWPGFLSVWLFGGLAALSGAVSYAELGGMFPRAGGDFVFQEESYGSAVAFASGWVLFAGIFAGSIAALSVPLFQYQIPRVLEGLGVSIAPQASVGPTGLTVSQWLGIATVGVLTGINTLGVRLSSVVQVLTTMLPIAVLTLGAVAALAFLEPAGSGAAATGPVTWSGYAGAWIDAYLAAYFAYSGWNAVIYVAGEVDEPGRTLPFGLVGGSLLVTLVYTVLCTAFVAILGFGGLAEAAEAGTAAAEVVLGSSGGWVVAGIVAIAMIASINATVLGGARVAYAMAGDRAFPSTFARLNGRDVPARALWLQALLASLLIATGTFEQIVELVGLAMMFIGALTVGAVWVLRRRRPDIERPYHAWGFPWFPAIYLLSSAVIVVGRVGRAFTGGTFSDWYPVVGLSVFGAALAAGVVWERVRPEDADPGAES